ncbi:PREDICTED: zinc finger protein 90-like isoform X2 [Priapulus caudatus]|uniref:Zinc finger protein 90-like isoform X1 n=1 Tax=Priapulus caudatus TaxID=37621 RepID=A0ABM1EE06_PRICU|nr:PREDICTED: zinc finger protein 90-like isoform X1 [Priapulus caudatus]XP_014670427.1 PREDICTED: zinc finger protein 90-like isoform X2 [Priapulus caudatus]
MTKHYQQRHEEPRYTCEHCGKLCRFYEQLTRHIEAKHLKKIIRCEYCPFKTKVSKALTVHMRVHMGRGITCDVCGKQFPTRSQLTSHMVRHQEGVGSICDQCAQTFKSKGSLEAHVRRKHQPVSKEMCPECSFMGDPDYVQKHIERVHRKQFRCGVCDYATNSDVALERHLAMHDDSRPMKCSQCEYRARDDKTLLDHVRNRHTAEELTRVHACGVCGKRFKTRTMLKSHMPSHTNAKTYCCNFCNYACKYRQTLYYHLRVKHDVTSLATGGRSVAAKQETLEISGGIEIGGDSAGEHTVILQLAGEAAAAAARGEAVVIDTSGLPDDVTMETINVDGRGERMGPVGQTIVISGGQVVAPVEQQLAAGDSKDIGQQQQQETYVLRLSEGSQDTYVLSKESLARLQQGDVPSTIILQQRGAGGGDGESTYIVQTEADQQAAETTTTTHAAEILQQLMSIAHTGDTQEVAEEAVAPAT